MGWKSSGWLMTVPPGMSMTQSALRKGAPSAICSPQTQWTGSSPSFSRDWSISRIGEPDDRESVFWKKKGVLYVRTEKPGAHALRRVLEYHAVPGHGVDLGVQSHVRAAIDGGEAAARKRGLPAALVEVEPHVGRRSGRGVKRRGSRTPQGERHMKSVSVGLCTNW